MTVLDRSNRTSPGDDPRVVSFDGGAERQNGCRSVPDKLMRTRAMPRTTSCIFLSGLTLLAALLSSLQRLELLGVASLLSGFAFGGFQGVVPAITSEIFGLQHLATNYAMLQLGPAAGEPHCLRISLRGAEAGGKGSTSLGEGWQSCILLTSALLLGMDMSKTLRADVESSAGLGLCGHTSVDESSVVTSAGSYLLATYLAGTLYDRQARKFKHGLCKGPACFRLTFLVIAGLAAAALVISFLLHRRTRPLYERVIADTLAERSRRGREVSLCTALHSPENVAARAP